MKRVVLSLGAIFILSACGEAPADDAQQPASAPTAVAPQTATAESPRPTGFAQCIACHSVEPGVNGLGPTLAGVFGAKAGHIGDFAYSSAMRESGITWDEASLDRYLENPRQAVPGTKMSFVGMRDAEKRAEVIEYLKGL